MKLIKDRYYYRSIKKLERRIKKGEIDIIPGNPDSLTPTTDYILYSITNSVYVKYYDTFYDVDQETFTNLQRHFWRVDKQDDKFASEPVFSYDAFMSNESGDRFIESIPDTNTRTPEAQLIFDEYKKIIWDAIYQLPERKQKVIIDIFFLDKTEAEVADELGCTQANISALKSSALKSLRNLLQNREEELEL